MMKIALYLGVGMLVHLVWIGPAFVPTSTWSWVAVLLWPIALLLIFYAWVILVVVVLVAGFLVWDRWLS